MDLDPNENIYVSDLKNLVDGYIHQSRFKEYHRLVKNLGLTDEERGVFLEYFLMPDTLNFEFASRSDKDHLTQIVFKYFRLKYEM